nr:hypothetical protein BaRGS_000012 [Batillaria attramentaria]
MLRVRITSVRHPPLSESSTLILRMTKSLFRRYRRFKAKLLPMSSKFKNCRITRWALALQEFRFRIEPVQDKLNVFADCLSRSGSDQLGLMQVPDSPRLVESVGEQDKPVQNVPGRNVRDDLEYVCPAGQVLHGVQSKYVKNDRYWNFTCQAAPVSTSCLWSSSVNRNGHPVSKFSCGSVSGNHVVTGWSSLKANQYKDDARKYRCCKLANVQVTNCDTTDWLIKFQGDLGFTAPSHQPYIYGIHSKYDKDKGDWLFKFEHCAKTGNGSSEVRPPPPPVPEPSDVDRPQDEDKPRDPAALLGSNVRKFSCSDGQALRHLHSEYYDNDRHWNFTCEPAPVSSTCYWSDKANYHGEPETRFFCAKGDYVLTGWQSVYSKKYRDDEMKYRCCKLKSDLDFTTSAYIYGIGTIYSADKG